MPSAVDSKPSGYRKKCRDCDKPIYLHRGPSGPWRAYDPLPADAPPDTDYTRHRCSAALQDAEIMGIIAPAGTKPADFIPRLKRVIKDFQGMVDDAEKDKAAAEAAAAAAAAAAASAEQ